MIGKIQGKKVVGIKQTAKVIKGRKAITVYLAKDAESKVTQPLEELSKQNDVTLVYIDTMKELGHMCGIDVGAAAAALINE